MQSSTTVQLKLDSPLMCKKEFAQKLQLSEETVRGLIQTKQLPTKKVGRYRLINMAALTAECLSDAGINTSFIEEK